VCHRAVSLKQAARFHLTFLEQEAAMPFLNDMLEQSRRSQAQNAAMAAENIADAGVVHAHLATLSTLQSRYLFDIDTIMTGLSAEILGQEQALRAVEDMLHVIRADITDPRRPLFTALFLGPTGVGKTEIVRALAKGLHGDADAFCRVDMNTLSQEHYAAALTGAPPGYVGAKEGTTLLDQEKLDGSIGRPGIVLFDELEKASPQVIQALLNILDNGLLTVASGERTYNFRNTIIFMTSNLAAHEIQRYDESRKRFPGRLIRTTAYSRHCAIDRIVRTKLLKAFAPEFINRIDNVITFNWIERNLIEQLVALEVTRLNRRLNKHHCRLAITPAVTQMLARLGFDRQFGARALRRCVRRHLEVPLAKHLLEQHPTESSGPTISYLAEIDAGKIRFIQV
jgi:ATP-dependent Clp protease ATP-binding subunit ClpA